MKLPIESNPSICYNVSDENFVKLGKLKLRALLALAGHLYPKGKTQMKKKLRPLALVLAASVLTAAFIFPASAREDDYYTYLTGLGFPSDYAEKLAELHILHPNWSFEPLLVTELNSKYSWNHVIYMETADAPNRSLVTPNPDYAAYRHATNKTPYDSGWYQASTAAVEYMMDPRNFLNEKDIFQFEELGFKDSVSISQIEAALAGTFMAGAYLENGKTFAEYFYDVGLSLGVSPLHLAARARQEQGLFGTAPQVVGSVGNRLWYYYSNNIQHEGTAYINSPSSGHTETSLKSYNNLYNFYNIGAGGTGLFAILLGAAREAEIGTPDMASEWGGSGRWDTKWKSIYGGAYKLRGTYINNYQNTHYLQKWNVDNRSKTATGASRNFWGQYMQNIGAALSEARTTYATHAAEGGLDFAFNFLIPVYSGMPPACPDPAGGTCPDYAISDTKYSYASELTLPASLASAKNKYITTSAISAPAGDNFVISGWSVHTYGIDGYEYNIDGGEWKPITASFSQAVAAANPEYVRCAAEGSINSFSAALDISALSPGAHSVALRGLADFGSDQTYTDVRYYLIALINISVKEASSVTVTIVGGEGEENTSLSLEKNSVYSLPAPPLSSDADTYFAGWSVASESARLFLPAGVGMTLLGNITLTPVYIDLRVLVGAELKISLTPSLRFTAAMSYNRYAALANAAGAANIALGMVICKTTDLGALALNPAVLYAEGKPYITATSSSWRNAAHMSGEFYGFDGSTPAITSLDFTTDYSAAAYVRLKYSDATVAYICSAYTAERHSRSAKAVAAAALEDGARIYSADEREILEKIAK